MTSPDSVEHLRSVLAALKDAGVLKAQVKIGHEDPMNMTTRLHLDLAVEFTPELPTVMPGDRPAPGGWKTLPLDDPFNVDPDGSR